MSEEYFGTCGLCGAKDWVMYDEYEQMEVCATCESDRYIDPDLLDII